jgi:hypothetical protein
MHGGDAARRAAGSGSALGRAGRALAFEPTTERGVSDAEALGDGTYGAGALLVCFDGTRAEVKRKRHGCSEWAPILRPHISRVNQYLPRQSVTLFRLSCMSHDRISNLIKPALQSSMLGSISARASVSA